MPIPNLCFRGLLTGKTSGSVDIPCCSWENFSATCRMGLGSSKHKELHGESSTGYSGILGILANVCFFSDGHISKTGVGNVVP